MNRTTALRIARHKWGDTATVMDRGAGYASTPEKRQAAGDARKVLPRTYQNRKEDDRLFSESVRYRYAVGNIAFGLLFEIMGTGDTWQEALQAAGCQLNEARAAIKAAE
jgi:hypothetical protein